MASPQTTTASFYDPSAVHGASVTASAQTEIVAGQSRSTGSFSDALGHGSSEHACCADFLRFLLACGAGMCSTPMRRFQPTAILSTATVFAALLVASHCSREIRIALTVTLFLCCVFWSMALKLLAAVRRVIKLRCVPTVEEGSWATGQTSLLNPKISLANWRRWLLAHPRLLRLRRIPLDDFLVVHHPETIGQVLKSGRNSREEYVYSFLSPWLGKGLVANCSPECAATRRLLAPAFSSRHADFRRRVYSDGVSELGAVWDAAIQAACDSDGDRGAGAQQQRGAVIDIQHAMRLLSLDIILQCTYSYKSNCQRIEHTNKTSASSSSCQGKNPGDDVMAYVTAVPRLLSMVVERLLYFPHHSNLLYWRSSAGRTYRTLVRTAHDFTERQICNRLQEQKTREQQQRSLESQNEKKMTTPQQDGTSTASTGHQQDQDFLEILQQARRGASGQQQQQRQQDQRVASPMMSDEDFQALKCDLETFVFAGHDTTAMAMMWILYYLAVNPEAQHGCYTEVTAARQREQTAHNAATTSSATDDSDTGTASDSDAIGGRHGNSCGETGSSSTATSTSNGSGGGGSRPYLTACIKESLRLSSVVPFIHRRLAEDTLIGGHTIPRDTRVMVSLWGLHHNPDVWQEPESFRPERFLAPSAAYGPGAAAASPLYDADTVRQSFLPFATGDRGCLGQRMAMEELTVVLGLLVHRYQFTWDSALTGPAPEPYPTIVMHSQNGLRLLVSKRVDK